MSRIFQKALLWGVPLFLVMPLIIVAGVSLNAKKSLLFPPRGFSLRWYGEIFQDPAWMGALTNSVIIAFSAAILAVSVAFPLAWFLWRFNVKYARALFLIGVAPFLMPPVITAVGFLTYWVTIDLYGSMITTIISHGVFLVTLPLVAISLGLESVDHQLIEAARTMGADGKTEFRTIVWPMARPYVISGFAFSFVISLNEYIIAYMVAGFTVETLPIKIFNSLRYGYTPVMASVAVFFVVIAMIIFGLMARFGDLPRMLGAFEGEKK